MEYRLWDLEKNIYIDDHYNSNRFIAIKYDNEINLYLQMEKTINEWMNEWTESTKKKSEEKRKKKKKHKPKMTTENMVNETL